MKLYELLDVIDPGRCSELERIQIVDPNGDSWDSCDEVSIGSPLLLPLNNFDVKCIEAIDKNVIRIDVDWPNSKVEEWLSWYYSDDTELDGLCGPEEKKNGDE